jgi:hypothetical protein
MTFHSRTLVKAGRKAHRCDNCFQPIEVGQSSILVAGVHDGDFSSYRVHPECDDLWNEIYKEMDCWDCGMDLDTIEALGLGRDELVPALEEYAKRHPVAVERLMVRVRKWQKEDAE